MKLTRKKSDASMLSNPSVKLLARLLMSDFLNALGATHNVCRVGQSITGSRKDGTRFQIRPLGSTKEGGRTTKKSGSPLGCSKDPMIEAQKQFVKAQMQEQDRRLVSLAKAGATKSKATKPSRSS